MLGVHQPVQLPPFEKIHSRPSSYSAGSSSPPGCDLADYNVLSRQHGASHFEQPFRRPSVTGALATAPVTPHSWRRPSLPKSEGMLETQSNYYHPELHHHHHQQQHAPLTNYLSALDSRNYDTAVYSSRSTPVNARHQARDSQPSSRLPSRPASPIFQGGNSSMRDNGKGAAGSSIASYLQIPATITDSKGSLAEFAAQITCLFWFESSTTLNNIEDATSSPLPSARLVPEAFPATGFLKWVTTILSTTQVTQNVILLALLFVYRLKKQNPSVKGKPGSEYRLLTVALMLGNKFLDDNTYTNKTWAEVSGISVHEIHVMEVEFLSHMKYNLYTSKEEWEQWHTQLGKFWKYFDRASRKLNEITPKMPVFSTRHLPLQVPYALPSPPGSNSASPPYVATSSPSTTPYGHSTALTAPTLAPPPSDISPTASIPEADWYPSVRKRSWDEAMHEYQQDQNKRHHSYTPFTHSTSSFRGTPHTRPTAQHHSSAAPAASLPTPMSHYPQPQLPKSNVYYPPGLTSTPGQSNRLSSIHLPPVNWVQGVNMTPSKLRQSDLASSSDSAASWIAPPPASMSYQPPASSTFAPTYPSVSSAAPYTYQSNPAPATTSTPAAHHPSIASHVTQPSQLSPSYFLTRRTSPYRPVRDISTLLVSPPRSSYENPTTSIPQNQMRWQPLSKNTNEYKTGRVPYLHRDAWPQTHQVDQWPVQSYDNYQ